MYLVLAQVSHGAPYDQHDDVLAFARLLPQLVRRLWAACELTSYNTL